MLQRLLFRFNISYGSITIVSPNFLQFICLSVLIYSRLRDFNNIMNGVQNENN